MSNDQPDARQERVEARLAAFHEAALAQDASEGSPPGQYDCYKSWSEIAIDYADEIQRRIVLEAECERLRKRNAELVDAIYEREDPGLTNEELESARERARAKEGK